MFSIPLRYLSLLGGEVSTGSGPSVCGAGSMTITELTTTTTHLHTKTTTIGPSQPPHKQLPAVGGALPGGGVASGQPAMGGAMPGGGMASTSGQWSGIGEGQRSSGASALQSQKKALVQYRMYNNKIIILPILDLRTCTLLQMVGRIAKNISFWKISLYFSFHGLDLCYNTLHSK